MSSGDSNCYQTVPGLWTSYPGQLPITGYATFRLKVLLPRHDQPLAIANDGQGTAYRIWVNDRDYGGVGRVATNLEEMVAAKKRTTRFLKNQEAELDIVVQVSNFHHRKAGFRNPLILGSAEELHLSMYTGWMTDAFVLGTIICIAVYFIFLYLSRREDVAPLYFALLCLVVSLRAGLTNRNLLGLMFPEAAWAPLLKIEYLTFYWALFFYIGFMRTLYPREYGIWLMRSNGAFATVFTLLTLAVDTLTASHLIPWYQVIHFSYMAAVVFSIVPVVYYRRPYYLYIGSASLIVGVFNILELAYLSGHVATGYFNHIGFLAFIFVQAVMLSIRSADTHAQITQLSATLERRNAELEESENKYRSLFEDSSDTIILLSNEGRIVDANPACETLLGYSPADLREIDDLDTLAPEVDQRRIFQTMQRDGAVIDAQGTMFHRDGREIPVLLTAMPRLNEDGAQIGYQAYVRNISDRLEAIAQRQRAEELEVIATVDPLTQAYNRRHFEQAAEAERDRAQRNGTPLTVILLDIDHFKHINDTYGHHTGDEVLSAVSDWVRQAIRKSDIFARYGGEEFVLLLPNTDLHEALIRAEQLRQGIEAIRIASDSGEQMAVRVSLGVAHWEEHQTLMETMNQADHALYRAKKSGRNRTAVWGAINTTQSASS